MADSVTPQPLARGLALQDGDVLNKLLARQMLSSQDTIVLTSNYRPTAFNITASMSRFTTVALGALALMPAANPGAQFLLVNAGANPVIVQGYLASDTINGASAFSLPSGTSILIQCFTLGLWITTVVTTTAEIITGGSIDNATIGQTVPNLGTFTTLSATTLKGGQIQGMVISGGSLDAAPIGQYVPAAGGFTTLVTSSSTLGVATATSLNGATIGAVTPEPGTFTTLAAANGGAIKVTAAHTTTGLTLQQIADNGWLTPQMFGAVGDGVTNDSVAVANWFTAVLTYSKAGYIPPGHYNCPAGIVVDVAPAAYTGYVIEGAGGAASVFNVAGCSTSPQFYVKNSNFSSNFGASFYGTWSNFGIEGNLINGVAAQWGGNYVPGGIGTSGASYPDAFNDCTLTGIVVANRATSGVNTVALRLNSWVTSVARITANCGGVGVGTALQFGGVAMARIRPAVGNCGIGVQTIDGYSFGYVLEAGDYEVLRTPIQFDSSVGGSATILGGSMVWGTDSQGSNGVGSTIIANGASAGNCSVIGVNPSSGAFTVTGAYAPQVYIPGRSIGTLYAGQLAANPLTGGAYLELYPQTAGQPGMVQMWSTTAGVGHLAFQTGWDGSNFVVQRFNTAGVYQDSPLYIAQTSGLVSFPNPCLFSGNLGFYGATPIAKPVVTGSISSNTVMSSLLTALTNLGLITNSTTG